MNIIVGEETVTGPCLGELHAPISRPFVLGDEVARGRVLAAGLLLPAAHHLRDSLSVAVPGPMRFVDLVFVQSAARGLFTFARQPPTRIFFIIPPRKLA